MKRKFLFLTFMVVCATLSFMSCATTSGTDTSIAKKEDTYEGLKRKVAIAKFSNEAQYAKGAFYDKENDPLGKQASEILATKLAATKKFILLERDNLDVIEKEQAYQNLAPEKIGADYLIIGSVTEYGRKVEGGAFGVGGSKSQIVQCGVSIRLVDVSTGEVIYSEEGKGEVKNTSAVVLGMGKVAGYDATLADKAISEAIKDLVENIVKTCENRPWKSYFVSYDSDAIIISGGKHQGIKVGDQFKVSEKGKRVKNPQTGMYMELPGKEIGAVKVIATGGDTAENEYSFVEFVSGSITPSKLENYVITDR